MALISKVELWKDCGFTDGCVEVPAYSDVSKLPAVDITLEEGFYPSKARMFSEMKVKCDNVDSPTRSFYLLQQCSYLRITVDYNNPQLYEKATVSQVTYYGWIDSVTLESDTTDFGMVLIKWHVDLWRTYLQSATFGAGVVTRRSSASKDPQGTVEYPYQRCSKRFEKVSSSVDLFGQSDDLLWVIVGYVSESESATVTESIYLAAPVSTWTVSGITGVADVSWRVNAESEYHVSPHLEDFVSGSFDEDLKITPSRICGVWVTPVAPVRYTVDSAATPTSSLKITLSGNVSQFIVEQSDHSMINLRNTILSPPTKLNETVRMESDELQRWSIVNERNEVVYTLPPRIGVTSVQVRDSISASGCYISIRLISSDVMTDMSESPSVGMEVRIAMPTLDVTENSHSEYYYTGARDYDIEQRRINTETSHTEGYTSALTGGMSGAMTGAMTGMAIGASAGPIGAVVGAIAGTAGSLISNELNYSTEKSANDRLQASEDTYQARQSENLLMYGSPPDWIIFGSRAVRALKFVPDEYSSKLYSSQISLNGVQVSEPTLDCTSLVQGTGPLQISQLVVGGTIPVEAKRYIKMRLENGVRLIASASEAEEEETV